MRLLFFFILVLEVSESTFSSFKISTQRSLSSPRKVFELGFFKPAPSSGGADRWHLGIWHRRFPKEVVWVANRASPLSNPIGTIKVINTDLVLLDGNGTRAWWTNVTTRTNPMKPRLVGELLDTGNFVLRYADNNDSSLGFLWQSFDFPTDALVSGMKLGWDSKSNVNRVLQSWRRADDPSPGEFTYGVERHELAQSYIRKKGVAVLRSDPWKTRNDMEAPSENLTYASFNITVTNSEATYFFTVTNQSFFSVLRLNYEGQLNRSTWIPKPHRAWKLIDRISPRDACDRYKKCGANGVCDTSTSRLCYCIQGFKPKDTEAWALGDWTGGCVRTTEMNCSGNGFTTLKTMKFPDITDSFVDRTMSLTSLVKLIASVQHVNLVQVLGYCLEGEEMVLIFEYLENSSLDTYIFDETQSSKLDWEKRFEITNGIARGLLYLHQDSRFRIIHRDLKPSNVLLDKDMVPKISDFGMAKLFKRDETEASTTKTVGTYGYMSPEYAIDGIYSVKSDVFSFGVMVLEIISGKRNKNSNEESLINHIWKNWMEGKGLEIVDPVLLASSSPFQLNQVRRCIQIGLLCVQERAEDRPAMSNVVSMLTSETQSLDQPGQPGFSAGTSQMEETWTVPDVTNSVMEGR